MAEKNLRQNAVDKFMKMGVPEQNAINMIDDMLKSGLSIEEILNAKVEAVSGANLLREQLEEYIGKIMGQLRQEIDRIGMISEKENPTILDLNEKEKAKKKVNLNIGCLTGIQSTLAIISLTLENAEQKQVCKKASEEIMELLDDLFG